MNETSSPGTRDRATIAALLRHAADAIEQDETIPVPAVSLHFMTHSYGIEDQPAALLAAARQFTCEWTLSTSHSDLVDMDFLDITGRPAEGVRVSIGGGAPKLAELDATRTIWRPLPEVAALVSDEPAAVTA